MRGDKRAECMQTGSRCDPKRSFNFARWCAEEGYARAEELAVFGRPTQRRGSCKSRRNMIFALSGSIYTVSASAKGSLFEGRVRSGSSHRTLSASWIFFGLFFGRGEEQWVSLRRSWRKERWTERRGRGVGRKWRRGRWRRRAAMYLPLHLTRALQRTIHFNFQQLNLLSNVLCSYHNTFLTCIFID